MRRTIAMLAITALISACSLLPKPPTEPPEPCGGPCPEFHQCNSETNACEPIDNCHLDDWPWCNEVDQQCSSTESPCKTNPSQDPFYCEEAIKCDDPLPTPQCPTFTDRGGTLRAQGESCDCWMGEVWAGDCEPPPAGECPAEVTLVASTCFTAYFHGQVKVATNHLGDLSGSGTQEEMHKLSKENLDKLAEQLRIQMPNRCIISGIEAIFIVIKDGDKNAQGNSNPSDVGKYEENHSVFFKNGSWTNSGNGRYIGCHVNAGGGTPPPVDPPPVDPPTGDCPAPHPDLTKMKFQSKELGNHLDTTWITNGQPEFCASIGYCCMPGTGTPPNTCGSSGCIPRGGCPVRGDGDPIRGTCEMELCNQKWECNGEPHPPWRGNPAQTDCVGHYKTWCSAPGSTAVLEGNR